jgi:IS30 family transposase
MKCNTFLIELFLSRKTLKNTVLPMLQYTQLSLGERVKIYDCQKKRMSLRQAAKVVGRPASTICRELGRNGDEYGYLFQGTPTIRKNSASFGMGTKVERSPILEQYVIEKLNDFWSPISIAGRWSLEHPDHAITHESIYNFIYSDKGQELKLWKLLPRKKGKRGFVSRQCKKVAIQNCISIHHRPEHIELREDIGHLAKGFSGECQWNTASIHPF